MSDAQKIVKIFLEDDGESARRFLLRTTVRAGRVEDYKVVAHGIDGEQYFLGAGIANTDWTDVSVGIGDNPYEALEDALNSAAEIGWKVDAIKNDLPVTPSASDVAREQAKDELLRVDPDLADDEDDLEMAIESALENFGSELHYYVILYLKGKQPSR